MIAFLRQPETFDPPPARVDVIETHGAIVFLAGRDVYKIKRAVRYAYMDYGTLERRHLMCLRELEINQPHAPEIYRDVVPITREADGRLAIGGEGTPVEWAVHMARFDQSALLSRMAERDALGDDILTALADRVADYHARAPVLRTPDGKERIGTIVTELADAFTGLGDALGADRCRAFVAGARRAVDEARYCLRMRGRRGFVRRCHGDLHLENVVLIEGRPVLFDAIEFNDDLATIDTLYDLAFLLMDLDQRDRRAGANLVLNRYLFRTSDPADIYGLKAMGLFLACRAAIRAMVTLQRADRIGAEGESREQPESEARAYLEAAIAYLAPVKPRLVAIGGFSGTGKTTLARALAPDFGAAPGALVLRSDLERKAMFGLEETVRLGPEHYTPEVSRKVYDFLLQKAHIALRSGRSVILDAVFSSPQERLEARRVAEALRLPFTGIWLTAERNRLIERVATRKGDASDATPAVVDAQIERGTGPIAWTPVEAGGTPERTLAEARAVLGLAPKMQAS